MNRYEMLKALEIGIHPLEVSIIKWQEIAKGKAEDQSDHNCALCYAYRDYTSQPIDECGKCPVKQKTGKDCCHGSPWFEYYKAELVHDTIRKKCFAKLEVKFLKSLRKSCFHKESTKTEVKE